MREIGLLLDNFLSAGFLKNLPSIKNSYIISIHFKLQNNLEVRFPNCSAA